LIVRIQVIEFIREFMMYGVTVKLNGKEYFVLCCPDTPHSEILSRAAAMAKEEEGKAPELHLLIEY